MVRTELALRVADVLRSVEQEASPLDASDLSQGVVIPTWLFERLNKLAHDLAETLEPVDWPESYHSDHVSLYRQRIQAGVYDYWMICSVCGEDMLCPGSHPASFITDRFLKTHSSCSQKQ